MGGGYYLTYDQWSFGIDEAIEPAEYADPAAAEEPVFVPAIVDLAGDPMIINIGRAPGDLPKTREVPRPEKLMFPGISDEITVLSDSMLASSERFMTTLPSTQEDFAFFQAQRSRPATPEMTPETAAPLPAEGPDARRARRSDARRDSGGRRLRARNAGNADAGRRDRGATAGTRRA